MPNPEGTSPRMSVKDVKEIIDPIRREISAATTCFDLRDGRRLVPKINHNGASFTQVREYWGENGLDEPEINQLVNNRGEWILRPSSENPYEMSVSQLNAFLKDTLRPINKMIDRSLDGSLPEGFNKHGEEHAEKVARRATSILKKLGYDEDVIKVALIAAWGHDIGNLLGRKSHHMISANILARVMPKLIDEKKTKVVNGFTVSEPTNWNKISRAIRFNGVDEASALVKLRPHLRSAEERLEWMMEFYGPEGLAVIIADKIEVGRDRISDKITPSEIRNDKHAEVNLLVKNEGLDFGKEGKEWMRWDIKFNPDIGPHDQKKFPTWANSIKRRKERGEMSSFNSWYESFWRLYRERIILMAEASFAIAPSINRVDIALKDVDGTGSVRTFNRATLDSDIAMIRNYY